MTPDEKNMLDSLASRIANTPVSPKDPEADALIRQRLGSNPDALYVLTQTVLIQDIALNQAKAQMEELRQRIAAHTGSSSPPASEPHTSFLGRIFGTGGSEQPVQNRPPSYNPPTYEGSASASAKPGIEFFTQRRHHSGGSCSRRTGLRGHSSFVGAPRRLWRLGSGECGLRWGRLSK